MGFLASEEKDALSEPCPLLWTLTRQQRCLSWRRKKKRRKAGRQRGFLVAPEGALPLQMRQEPGSGWSWRLNLSVCSPGLTFQLFPACVNWDRVPPAPSRAVSINCPFDKSWTDQTGTKLLRTRSL